MAKTSKIYRLSDQALDSIDTASAALGCTATAVVEASVITLAEALHMLDLAKLDEEVATNRYLYRGGEENMIAMLAAGEKLIAADHLVRQVRGLIHGEK